MAAAEDGITNEEMLLVEKVMSYEDDQNLLGAFHGDVDATHPSFELNLGFLPSLSDSYVSKYLDVFEGEKPNDFFADILDVSEVQSPPEPQPIPVASEPMVASEDQTDSAAKESTPPPLPVGDKFAVVQFTSDYSWGYVPIAQVTEKSAVPGDIVTVQWNLGQSKKYKGELMALVDTEEEASSMVASPTHKRLQPRRTTGRQNRSIGKDIRTIEKLVRQQSNNNTLVVNPSKKSPPPKSPPILRPRSRSAMDAAKGKLRAKSLGIGKLPTTSTISTSPVDRFKTFRDNFKTRVVKAKGRAVWQQPQPPQNGVPLDQLVFVAGEKKRPSILRKKN